MDDNSAEEPGNKYRSIYNLLDFVLDPGVLHYCASCEFMNGLQCEPTVKF